MECTRTRIDCPLALVPPLTETGSLPRSDQANRFLFATRDTILLSWLELAANPKETRSRAPRESRAPRRSAEMSSPPAPRRMQ